MPMYAGGQPARLYLGGSPLESLYHGGVEIYRDTWSAWTRVTGATGTALTVPVPTWAAYMDVLSLGGGGGGATGDGGANRKGNGGSPGRWSTATVEVSRSNNTAAYVLLGNGGAGGDGSAGAIGGVTYWDFTGVGRVAPASGGAGGSGTGGRAGGAVSPAPLVLGQSTGIAGGTSAGDNTNGRDPGGGGGPGTGGIFGRYQPGRPGGPGGAWYRFRSWRP